MMKLYDEQYPITVPKCFWRLYKTDIQCLNKTSVEYNYNMKC